MNSLPMLGDILILLIQLCNTASINSVGLEYMDSTAWPSKLYHLTNVGQSGDRIMEP